MPLEFKMTYFGDVGARITDTGEGYELYVTDHVANEFTETYPTLDAAVGRLGLLIRSCDTDRPFIDTDPAEHFRRWDALCQEALHP